MDGLDFKQVRTLVVRPVLQILGLHSEAAENLLLGTAAQESRGRYLKQLGDGPAVGIFQMEPATHDDIWANFLAYRDWLRIKIKMLEIPTLYTTNNAKEMAGNLYYAAAMCRVHYLRVPEPLPDADDVEGMGRYWKQHYNTKFGKGEVSEFVHSYLKCVR